MAALQPSRSPLGKEGKQMDVDVQGGCLCGAVRYQYRGRAAGALGAVTLCHCALCRRSGSYGIAVLPAERAGFTLLQGADAVVEYSATPGKVRAFCGRCGTPLYSSRDDKPDALRLRLGALDAAPAGLRIEAHIHCAGVPDWAAPAEDGAARYPGAAPAPPSA